MWLILGGAGQGKLDLALETLGLDAADVADGECCPLEALLSKPVADHLHAFLRRELEAGRDPARIAELLLERNPNAAVLCDEVGCGVVPADPFEREWREAVGRACCALAKEAGRVDRVWCGIAETIKRDGGKR